MVEIGTPGYEVQGIMIVLRLKGSIKTIDVPFILILHEFSKS